MSRPILLQKKEIKEDWVSKVRDKKNILRRYGATSIKKEKNKKRISW